MSVYTAGFWRGLAERAVATFIQALLAVVGLVQFTPVTADWGQIFLGAGMAAGLSVLKSLLAGLSNGSPSVTNAEVPVDAPNGL